MKKALFCSLILCLFFFAGQASAINLAEITFENPGFSSSDEFHIDIYAVSMDESFQLGDSTLRIQINTNVLSNPVLSEQNTDFHSNAYYGDMSVSTSGAYVDFQITASGTTGNVLPSTATRLARITFDINPSTYTTEVSGITAIQGTSSVKTAGGATVLFQFNDDTYENESMDCKPTLSGTPVTSIVDSGSYSFTPTLGGGCSPVTYSFSMDYNVNWWGTFVTSTGVLSGTATPVDTYSNIGISVTEDLDGDGASLSAFDIEVTSSCQAPTIAGSPASNYVKVGSSFSFTPTVSNGCGTLVYSINNPNNLDNWAALNTGSGVLSGTPAATHVGDYTGITITVTDGNSDSADLSAFNLEVCNDAAISGTPATSVVAGQAYSFTPTYTGCGDPTYDIENQPSWASFNLTTGVLSGTPTASDVGTYEDIIIQVVDETNDTDTLATFDITVTAASSGGGGGGGGGCFISSLHP